MGVGRSCVVVAAIGGVSCSHDWGGYDPRLDDGVASSTTTAGPGGSGTGAAGGEAQGAGGAAGAGTSVGPGGDGGGGAAGGGGAGGGGGTGVGVLSGTRTAGAWGAKDLTAEGTLDWAHWGLGGLSGFNRKSGVMPRISNYTLVGANFTLVPTTCCMDPMSWSDGTPTATATGVVAGVYVDTANPSGDGFELTFPADATTRLLRLYLGNWCVRAKLEAALSDASAAPYVDTSWDVPQPVTDTSMYTLTYAAAETGQVLTVRFLVDDNHCLMDDVGEVWLIAATLQDG